MFMSRNLDYYTATAQEPIFHVFNTVNILINIVPEDSSENFISTPSTFNITFHWLPPSIPNGVIIQYNLTVHNINTGTTTKYIINSTDHYTVGDFKPYQKYNASLSAGTKIGYGPPVFLSGRTKSDSE